MIDTKVFIEALRARGVSLFAGVPDSLLKEFSGCLMQMAGQADAPRHVITANEGNAVGLAIGHYLATGSSNACCPGFGQRGTEDRGAETQLCHGPVLGQILQGPRGKV